MLACMYACVCEEAADGLRPTATFFIYIGIGLLAGSSPRVANLLTSEPELFCHLQYKMKEKR